jgi:hypothetical protein
MGFNSGLKGLNRKEWCLVTGRRRQLSQDRKDRYIFNIALLLIFTGEVLFPCHNNKI